MDRQLLQRLDALQRRPFAGRVYRHYAPQYKPLSGDGARIRGGRWNPAESYSVLYTSPEIETIDREFTRALAEARILPAAIKPRELAEFDIRLSRVLDLRDTDVCKSLAITQSDLLGSDLALSQSIGEAAHHLGYEGILAPSATGAGTVLAVFPTNVAASSSLAVVKASSYRPVLG